MGPTVDLGPVPEWLVIDAVRYAQGRTSYQVDETCRWLISVWPALTASVREVIRRDVDRLIARDDHARGLWSYCPPFPAGHDCDRESWLSVQRLWRE